MGFLENTRRWNITRVILCHCQLCHYESKIFTLYILYRTGCAVDYKSWCHHSSSLLTSTTLCVMFCPEYFESSPLPLIANVLFTECFLFYCESPAFKSDIFSNDIWSFSQVLTRRGRVGDVFGFLTRKGNAESIQLQKCALQKCSLRRSYCKMLVNTINSVWELRGYYLFHTSHTFLGIPSSQTHTLHPGSDCTSPALRIYRLIYFALCLIFTVLSFHVR